MCFNNPSKCEKSPVLLEKTGAKKKLNCIKNKISVHEQKLSKALYCKCN